MPGAPDKIIINDLNFAADAHSMYKAFDAAKILGAEIVGHDLLKKAQQFVPEQKAICDALAKALRRAVDAQRELNDKYRNFIDDELGLNQP